MIKMIGAGILRDLPTSRGLRKYHSIMWIKASMIIIVTTILHPVYVDIPAKSIGMPPINIHKIGIKLVKKVIHPSARRYGKSDGAEGDICP